jgi:hypothetical protein
MMFLAVAIFCMQQTGEDVKRATKKLRTVTPTTRNKNVMLLFWAVWSLSFGKRPVLHQET